MLIIAHRGAGAYSPYNSRQAFCQAIALKSDMIETDIRVSKDNIPVIFHDPELPWGPIEQLNWREISKYRLTNGEYILSLEEMLFLFSSKIRFNLEIKPISLEKVGPILNILNKFNLPKPLLSSFSLPIINELAAKTNFETALLVEKKHPIEKLLQLLNSSKAQTLNLYYPLLEETLVNTLKEENYQVIVWTDFLSELIDPLYLYTKAYNLKCDGFITGKPDLLYHWLQYKRLTYRSVFR